MANTLIPYSFVPGTKALASEVNANFVALAQCVEEGRRFTTEAIENFNLESNEKLATVLDTKMSNSLNISNCLTEVPQTIKYTLENGKFTVKTGTILIVPYGTSSPTLSVGDNFVNNIFKVKDVVYADGKLFYRVEVLTDISTTATATATESANRTCCVNLSKGTISFVLYETSGVSDYSGNSNNINYRTDTNKVSYSSNGTKSSDVYSLPILRVTAGNSFLANTVTQTFNGFGYIGSTIWVDKGIKGLIPNGLNTDGTLHNTTFTTTKILTTTITSSRSNWTLYLSQSSIAYSTATTYNKDLNYNIHQTNGNYNFVAIARFTSQSTSFNITDFRAFSVLHLADYQEQILSLSEKADIDFSNCTKPYITTTYRNGDSWYRVWSDGFIEQGGTLATATGTITFPKPMTTTNYIVSAIQLKSSSYNSGIRLVVKTRNTSNMIVAEGWGTNSSSDTWEIGAIWTVKGY